MQLITNVKKQYDNLVYAATELSEANQIEERLRSNILNSEHEAKKYFLFKICF